ENDALLGSCGEHALEAGDVEDAHVLLVHLDQRVLLELGEQPAHRFQLEAEIAADLLARHAQVEVRRRVAAAHEAVRKVDEEGREALLGAHRAEQHHHAVVAHDLAREHRMEVPLQRRQLARHLLDQGEGHHADLAVLERDGVAVVAARADPVHAEELAAHEEARDLLAPVVVDQAGLEEAAADGVDRMELVAGLEQRLAALHAPPRIDDALHALQLVQAHTPGQAHLVQVAARARDLELARRVGPDHGAPAPAPGPARAAISSHTRSNSVLLSKKPRAPRASASCRYG